MNAQKIRYCDYCDRDIKAGGWATHRSGKQHKANVAKYQKTFGSGVSKE